MARVEEPDLRFEVDGAIAWITLDRPTKLNAITWPMYEGLFDACERFDSDDRLRILVLRGAGDRAFAAGADITQFDGLVTREDFREYSRRVDRVLARIAATAKPTIAMIRGICVGGGALIALSCDLRIAASDARFGMPVAATLGNALSSASLARVVTVLGAALTADLVFTARLVNAEEGRSLRVYHDVVTPERLESRARELAATIAANAPLTIRTMKRMLGQLDPVSTATSEEMELACYLSEDFREGVRAFREKRRPQWSGR